MFDVSTAGGTDMRSDIAATLRGSDSAPLQSGTGDTGAGAPEPAAAPLSQPDQSAATAPTETPKPEPQGEPTPQKDEEFTLDLDNEPESTQPTDEKVEGGEPDGKPADADAEVGALLATTRGKRIYASFKKDQALSRLPEEGGIGHSPTVEQVKDYYNSFVDTRAMLHDVESRDPKAADRFLQHWFGADKNGRFREGVDVVAGRLADVLAQTRNPKLYEAAAMPFLQTYSNAAIDRFMEQAGKATDANERDRWYMAAQFLHLDLYGKYFDPKTRGMAATQQAQPQQSEAEAELARLRAELAQRQTAEAQRTQQSYLKQVDQRTDAALTADVDKALEVLKDTVKPVVLNAIRREYAGRVREMTEKNREGMRLLQIAKERAARSGDESQIAALVKQWRQMSVNHIVALRKEYIEAAGYKAAETSQAKHAQLQQAAQKTAPAVGSPAAPNLKAAFLDRKPGESLDEYRRRSVRADLMGQ